MLKTYKKTLLTAIYAASIFIFSGCILDFLSYESEETTEYYASDEDTYFVKTLGSANTITLENVKGKTILYVNYNKSSSSTVNSGYLRYLSSSTGLNTSTSGITARTAGDSDITYENTELKEPAIKHFIPVSDMGQITASGDRSASINEPRFSPVNASDFSVGDTRYIYVDDGFEETGENKGNPKLSSKKATLYAKNSVCLVWIVNKYYSLNTASACYINQSVAEYIAEKFEDLYYHERYIFGEEGDYLIHETSSGSGKISETSMKDGDSPTGSLVNIVIYDIGNDYGAGNTSGVVGYFYSKDYWVPASNSSTMAKYSNEGKYFYLDSSFCNYVSSNSYTGIQDSEGNSIASDTAITTLYHEFQHMIDYYQKDYGSVETWYNEMLSMLAEDMFATNLGISESDAPWGARIPEFNSYYFISGIDEYRDDDLTVYSYSTAYTFGAWLAREFGGPEFISKVSQNSSTGMTSILAAIKEMTGETLSANQLRRRFIQACAFRNNFAQANSLPTLNKDAGGSITKYGFTSLMNAIDIYSSEYVLSDKDSSSQLGPAIYKNKSYPGSVRINGITYNLSALRPHGFQIHYAGVASADTVTLNFTSQKNSSEDIMILIQDEFDNTAD